MAPVFLLLDITGDKNIKMVDLHMVLGYKDSSLDVRSIVYPLNHPWEQIKNHLIKSREYIF